jgi:hypothetical protein
MGREDNRSLLMLEPEDIVAIQEENQRLRAVVRSLEHEKHVANAQLSVLDELHELLDLVHVDGSIHDLDQHDTTDKSTLATTLYEVLHRLQSAESKKG